MRVLHVHATPGALGGSERTALLAARGLRASGVENYVLYDDPPPPEASDFAGLLSDGIAFRSRQSPAAITRSYRRIAAYVRYHRIDIIHARLWLSAPLLRALLGMAPVVATAHLPVCPNRARYHYGTERPCDEVIGKVCLTRGRAEYKCGFTASLDPFGPLGLERGLIRAKAELRLLRACRAVMAPSDWQRQRLVRDGVPAHRIVVVPSPVEAVELAKRHAPPSDPPVVLFAARLVRFKGAHHLLEAVARIDRDLRVRIAGDGPESEPLMTLAARLGIADRVTFLGSLGPDELRAQFASATVVAVPSLFPETFNRTGPEALAQGTPVVAYASGGVGEWLRPGVTGMAVPTGDVARFASALRDVVEGNELTQVVGIQGPLVAAEFGVQRHAEKVIACYEAALGQASVGVA